jgi:predicted component of type VI protein secretion system
LYFAVSAQYLIEHFLIHQRLKNFGSKRRSAKSKNTGKDHSDKVNAYLKRIKKANEIFEKDALDSLDEYWQSKMVQLMNEVEQLTARLTESYMIVLDEKTYIKKNINNILSGLDFIKGENRNRILQAILAKQKSNIQIKVLNQHLKRWSQKNGEKALTEAAAKKLIFSRKLLYFSILKPYEEMKSLVKLTRDKDSLDFSI